jgi:hypothetical protein
LAFPEYRTQIFLGDLVILWRARVVWLRNKTVLCISALLVVALIGELLARVYTSERFPTMRVAATWVISLLSYGVAGSGSESITVPLPYAVSLLCSLWSNSAIAYKIRYATAIPVEHGLRAHGVPGNSGLS